MTISSAVASYSRAIAVPQSPNNGIRLLSCIDPIRKAVSPTKSSARLILPAESILPATLIAYIVPQHPMGRSMQKQSVESPKRSCRTQDVGGVGWKSAVTDSKTSMSMLLFSQPNSSNSFSAAAWHISEAHSVSGPRRRSLIPTVLSKTAASSLLKRGRSAVFTTCLGMHALTPANRTFLIVQRAIVYNSIPFLARISFPAL